MRYILPLLIASLFVGPTVSVAQTTPVVFLIDTTVTTTGKAVVKVTTATANLDVIFQAKDSTGTVRSTTASQKTKADGTLLSAIGPIPDIGTYTIAAVVSGAITPNPTTVTASSTLSVVAPPSGTPTTTTPSTTTPTTSGTAVKTSISIPNPLGNCNTASCLISRVIKSILGIVAIIATMMFIWGGLLMLTSGGNEKQVRQAKDTLTWAAIGIVIIMISWAVISFVIKSFVTTTS